MAQFYLQNFYVTELIQSLVRIVTFWRNEIAPLLLSPGPHFDNDSPGCPQFHFMPRFVRFLPGKASQSSTLSPSSGQCRQSAVRRHSTWWCCCTTVASALFFDSCATYLLFHQKTISLLSPPPLLQFILLQTLMCLFYKNTQKTKLKASPAQ